MPRLTSADATELVKRYYAGDKGALDTLAVGLQPLIRHLAKSFIDYRLSPAELDDVTQSGMVGLLKAVKNWDPADARNVQFMSYAEFYIKGGFHKEHRCCAFRAVTPPVACRPEYGAKAAMAWCSNDHYHEVPSKDNAEEAIPFWATIPDKSDFMKNIEDRELATIVLSTLSPRSRQSVKRRLGYNACELVMVPSCVAEPSNCAARRAIHKLRTWAADNRHLIEG